MIYYTKASINSNIRTEPISGPLKYYGIAEKAESLILIIQSIAGNFLRTDPFQSNSFRIKCPKMNRELTLAEMLR